jgi:hypothetical protein
VTGWLNSLLFQATRAASLFFMPEWTSFVRFHSSIEIRMLVIGIILLTSTLAVVAIIAGIQQAHRANIQLRSAMQSLDEQIRPVLRIEKQYPELGWRAPAQRIVLRNTGEGTAFHTVVELFSGTFDRSLGTYFGFEPFVIPPKQQLELAFSAYTAYSLLVIYQSIKGERFATSVSFPDGEARVAFQQNVTRTVSGTPFLARLSGEPGSTHAADEESLA